MNNEIFVDVAYLNMRLILLYLHNSVRYIRDVFHLLFERIHNCPGE